MPDPSRLQLPIASFLLILLFSPIILRSEEENSDRLTVFCTSNKDGTGACMTTSQEPVDCILVPGSVVDCNDQDKNELSCVSVHATSAIIEISCEQPNTENTEVKIEDETINIGQEPLADGELESAEIESNPDSTSVPTDQPLPEGTGDSPFADPF